MLLCLPLATACSREEPAEEGAARPVKLVTVGGPTEGVRRDYPGTVEAIQHVDMAFEVPGRIVDFPVEEGERVEEGAILARLDPRDYEAKRETAAANARKFEADLARTTRLYKEDPGAIALTQIDADRRAVEVGLAQLKEAEKALEDTTLRAPFSGYMARKLVRDFANVQAKEPVLILQDISTLRVVVSVPERDFADATSRASREELTARSDPRVVVSAFPDRSFPARWKELALTADPVTRTFAATFEFERPGDAAVLPGMTAKISVRDSRPQRVLTIPAQAVAADAERNPFVWIVDPATMRASKRSVSLGRFTKSDVEVLEGLETGEMIAVSGVHQLRDGMQVRRADERGAERRG